MSNSNKGDASFAPLPRAVALAHRVMRSHVSGGETVVDATVGNGHDTLFLAKLVGENGTVFGFDLQMSAIDSAQQKIDASGLKNVRLFPVGHEHLRREVGSQPINAAMFNLGYLPGGDKAVITRATTTVVALEACCDLGVRVITVVVYPGHEGGQDEADAVVKWASDLDQDVFAVAQYGFINQRNNPPFLLVIERK